MRLALTAAVLATLALPASALGATASVYSDAYDGTSTVSYKAAPGEVNDVTAERNGDSVVIDDPGADIAAGDGCVSTGAHSVTCSSAKYFTVELHADLGDQDDRFAAQDVPVDADGGDGHDVLAGVGSLRGEEGKDELDAGDAGTYLSGGPGDDTLNGGAGDDLIDGGPGADAIDGGGDDIRGDTVSYRDTPGPVTIDLSTQGSSAGAAGEGDTLTNVENAIGSDGADHIIATDRVASDGRGSTIDGWFGGDRIVGGPGDDQLYGNTGDDRISGGGGDDHVTGNEGRDTLRGGPGDDVMLGADAAPSQAEHDRVSCGKGNDAAEPDVGGKFALDTIAHDCEQVETAIRGFPHLLQRPLVQPVTSLRFGVHCAASHCRSRIALRAHGRLAGVAERRMKVGRDATITVALRKHAREELADKGVLRLRLSLVVRLGPNLERRRTFSCYLVVREPGTAR